MHVGGYHEYLVVMIPLKWENSSRIISTSHFMIAVLVSTFENTVETHILEQKN